MFNEFNFKLSFQVYNSKIRIWICAKYLRIRIQGLQKSTDPEHNIIFFSSLSPFLFLCLLSGWLECSCVAATPSVLYLQIIIIITITKLYTVYTLNFAHGWSARALPPHRPCCIYTKQPNNKQSCTLCTRWTLRMAGVLVRCRHTVRAVSTQNNQITKNNKAVHCVHAELYGANQKPHKTVQYSAWDV
jgi:hypothetical protein